MEPEARLEAILAYRPAVSGAELVFLGTTANLAALRMLRDALVEQARQEALRWKEIDEGVFALRAAEFEKLCKILAWLMPQDRLRPDLRIVKPEPRQPPPDAPMGPT